MMTIEADRGSVRARVAGLLAAAWMALFAPAGLAEDTVKIGVSGPFSGGSAPMGKSMRDGIRLAVEEINAYVGGVHGKKIELVELDDEADPEKGAAIAEELISRHKVVATVGVVNTGVGLASIDHYQKASVPLIVAVSTGAVLTKRFAPPAHDANFVFRLSPPTTVSTAYLASHLVDRLGLQRIAVLADDTGYGEAELADLSRALAEKGVTPVVAERFSIGDRDMTAQLGRARAAEAEAVVMFGIGPELAAIARNKGTMGWPVPLFGSWTVSMRNFIDGAGKSGNGVFAVQSFIATSHNGRHRAFVEDFTKRFGDGAIESPMSAAQGYDAMRILYHALAAAGEADGDQVRKALESRVTGVEGVVTTYMRPFTPEDHDAITANMLVMGVVRDGRIDYAFEEDARKSYALRYKRTESGQGAGR